MAASYRLRFFVGEGERGRRRRVARIRAKLAEFDAEILEEERDRLDRRASSSGSTATCSVLLRDGARREAVARSARASTSSRTSAARTTSTTSTTSPTSTGTHGIGHVRLATESDVSPEASHPFWATGFADVAIVHNGQITNYYKMRRRLEKRGFEFNTDNDSRADRRLPRRQARPGCLARGRRSSTSIEDLDGTFSFLVSTKDEIGFAKDRLAAKPMVMFEDDELVAIASEEVSLNRLFPGQALVTTEPAPGTFRTWRRSI